MSEDKKVNNVKVSLESFKEQLQSDAELPQNIGMTK
jgi:hypothetical protein